MGLLTTPAPAMANNPATLRELLAQGQAAFSAGDYTGASAIFERIQTEFAREPEVDNPYFQRVLLPFQGYAALLAGRAGQAVEFFEKFMRDFPNDEERITFVLFSLAQAQVAAGREAAAIETYDRFMRLAPNRPEAFLAALEASKLVFAQDRADEGFRRLDALYERAGRSLFGVQARLLALQEAIARRDTARARTYLLETTWAVDTMPELAVLAFAALDMGNQLLGERDFENALRSFRIVPPHRRLIELQQQRLDSTRANFEERRSRVTFFQGGPFWTEFYTGLIARLEGQLRGLREAEDYTFGLHLAMGQTYLLSGRPREAWIVFERLARDSALTGEQREQAHYRWILAAIDVGVWEDAFGIALGFGERFPESALVPESLYLLSRAHQESGQYRDAIRVLTALLEGYPQHELAPRWLFVRAFNHSLINEPAEARADFARFIREHRSHGLFMDARYWHAMAHFNERNYETALTELNDLLPDTRQHRLGPEVEYRIAATHYAKRDLDTALGKIQAFLTSHPLDARTSEARVLLGDIQMGRGELDEAQRIFAAIDPSAGHLFVYSVFQAGKILRALAGVKEPHEVDQRDALFQRHIAHFERFIDRDDVPRKTRLSEALYWIGWTHLEMGRPERANETFEAALARFGDDMEATEVPLIIDALARIRGMARPGSRTVEREAFLAWIGEQRQTALDSDRLTFYARLNLYLDTYIGRQGGDRPSSVLFETIERVPVEFLDAESLGRVAAVLVEDYPALAEPYLERLEEVFPDSMHRVYGYYARARLLMREGSYAEARSLLARFRSEAPVHPLSTEATLFHAETLSRTHAYPEAEKVLEDLLRLREARGRPHARALLLMSQNAERAGELRRAVGFAQRVYTVYRAFPDLMAEAYLLNARQFEALDDPAAAHATLVEMLGDARIGELDLADEARRLKEALETRHPERTTPAGTAPTERSSV